MKKQSFFALYIFPFIIFTCMLSSLTNARADRIKCYAGSKLIYSREVSEVMNLGSLYTFIEAKTGNTVFFNGICLAKFN